MKKNITIGFVLLGLALSFASCKRSLDDAAFQGKEVIAAPADFTGVVGSWVITRNTTPIVDSNSNLLRFAFGPNVKDYAFFHATFSHRVSWTITITGNRSGAIKTLSGTSQSIDATNAEWGGRSDGFTFFKLGESVKVVLSFLNSEISYTRYIKLNASTGFYDYSLAPVNVDTCVIVDDFDNESGLYRTRTTYSDVNDGVDKAKFVISNNIKVNELFSIYMKGTDGNGNGYLGGFSNQDLVEMAGAIKRTNPDEVYINAYIYGYGRPNSSLMFLLYESDTNTPPYKAKQDDNYQYIQEITWTGWKLVSIKYSAFKAASNPLAGGNGNRIKEPHKLVGIGAELQSYPTSSLTVEAAVDFITVTTGGPFVQ